MNNNHTDAAVSGVYKIRNTMNGKVYIGSAVNIRNRWYVHRCELRRGCHHSVHLQRSWAKHGEEAFAFEVIEECQPEKLIEREQFWIDTHQAAVHAQGYNISPTAGSMLGFRFSDESKDKLRAWCRSKLPHAVLVTYKGVTKTRIEHAKDHGLSPEIVAQRMNLYGWSIEDALETPVHKANTFTFQGKTLTIPEWAKETGIPYRTIHQRLYKFGWSIEEALTTIARQKVEYKGEKKLVTEWAKQYGIEYNTLRTRLAKGMSMEEALHCKHGFGKGPEPLLLTAFGRTQELRQWAAETGIKHTTIWSRIKVHGWTIEDALTTKKLRAAQIDT